jgi:signal transduction histidine kinase
MHVAAADILDLVIGALEFGLALIVLGHLWRFRRGFPWLIALIAFFLLRGADRVSIGMRANESTELGYLLDALELAALLLLVLGIERIARALERALDRAIAREHEYHRALRDYRRLVRHRIANPLTAILGSVRTLQEMTDLRPVERDELLDAIDHAAHKLQSVAIEPNTPLSAEERDLRPQPRVPRMRSEARKGLHRRGPVDDVIAEGWVWSPAVAGTETAARYARSSPSPSALPDEA